MKINTKRTKGNINKQNIQRKINAMNRKGSSGLNKKNIMDSQNKLILLAICVVLFLLCWLLMGFFLTITLLAGIVIIILLKKLLDKANTSRQKKKLINKIVIVVLTLGIVGVSCFCLFMLYVVNTAPKFDKSKLTQKQSTIIYDNKGDEVVRLGTQMRENITYDKLPDVLVDALVATEDSRFFNHNGVDIPRFVKASLGQLAHRNSGGASTLSMQIIKNTYTSSVASGVKGIVRKFTDIYLAVFKLEKNYTKEEIIEFYVNNHYLGNNAYGVQQASQVYFNKDASELNLAEASLLIGMFQAPSDYDPYQNVDAATKRRETVLKLMYHHGYITKEQQKIANDVPIKSLLAEKKETSSKYQGFIDTVVEQVNEEYGVNAYSTPLLIYSTMDRDRQNGVDDVTNGETLKWKDDQVQTGIAVLNVHNGRVLAVSAGRNKTGANTYNYATNLKRQPGSTIKPILDYGPAIEYENWSTYKLIKDTPYSYTNGPALNNWDGSFMGTMTTRNALAESRNVPALKAFQATTTEQKLEFVKKLHIDPTDPKTGELYESASVGAFNRGVSPVQLAAAYAAFANGGTYYKPHSFTKVVFRDSGEEKKFEEKGSEAMSEATAYMITNILQGVPNNVSKVKGINMTEKTGTTNYDDDTVKKYHLPGDVVNDCWAASYDPDTVFASWFGYNKVSSSHYYRMLEQAAFRNKFIHAIGSAVFKNKDNWKMPSSVLKIGVVMGSDPATLPSSSTPSNKIIYELFKKGSEPTETSDAYDAMSNPGNLSISYDDSARSISLKWSAVTPGNKKDDYGDFGYYVYKDGTKLGFTTDNSYTIDDVSNPVGTYTIVASFEKYTANQSSGASVEYKEQEAVDFTINQSKSSEQINIGSSYSTPSYSSIFNVYFGSTDITGNVKVSTLIKDTSGNTYPSIDTSRTNTFTITYDVVYNGQDVGSINYTVTVK